MTSPSPSTLRSGEGGMRSGPPQSVRVWAPVILSVVLQVPAAILLFLHTRELVFAATLALAVLTALSLAVIRRFPRSVVIFVIAATAADVLVAPFGPPFVSVAFAIVIAVRHGARAVAYIALAAAWTAVLVLAPLVGFQWEPRRIAPVTVGLLIVVGAAEFAKRRSDLRQNLRAEQLARQAAEEAKRLTAQQEERVRIARDLHDVLGHSLSQITVQANAGLHLMDRDPEEARRALTNVKETSASALAEVRNVLGMLTSPYATEPAPRAPAPGLEQLTELIDTVRRNGPDVTSTIDLPSNVPLRVAQSVYRIVQESLTNVVRHSGASRATVAVSHDGDSIRVVIEDEGSGDERVTGHGSTEQRATEEGPSERRLAAERPPKQSVPPGSTSGNGLRGMRERAELLGGLFSAGPTDAGGWRVDATVPINGGMGS